jgi:hypothetical protein
VTLFVRLERTTEVLLVSTAVTPETNVADVEYWTRYPVTDEPFATASGHVTVRLVDDATLSAGPAGASGVNAITTGLVDAGALFPTALIATTLKVYEVPVVRPEIDAVRAVPD